MCEPNKFYWLDPNGKFHQVGIDGHLDFAKSYFKNKVLKPREELYKLGWTRVVLVGYMGQKLLHFNRGYGSRISSIQMEKLEEFAIDNNVFELFDLSNNRRYNL